MQYDSEELPFWEKERGEGPITTNRLWVRERHKREKIQELRSQLAMLDQELINLGHSTEHPLRKDLLRRLEDLGYQPRAKQPKVSSRDNHFDFEFGQALPRVEGAIGEGCRWVGHGDQIMGRYRKPYFWRYYSKNK